MVHVEQFDFQYPRLEADEACIRLLRIRYDNEHQQGIYIDIRTFALDQCPSYKALSYTWGNPFPSEPVQYFAGVRFPTNEESQERAADWHGEHNKIHCNGSLIYVSLNLFEALAQLSGLREPGFLWVDRLCIDQDNELEKSIQVGLMSKIYVKADSVLIWLGPSGTDSSAALQIQQNFADPVYDLANNGKIRDAEIRTFNPGEYSPTDESYLENLGLHVTDPIIWFAWTQFFRRSFFYRRWTLQETALARKIEVLCGSQRLDWYKLRFLVKYFALSRWQPYLHRYGIPVNEPTRAMLAREFVEYLSSHPSEWKNDIIASHGKFSIGTVLTELLYRSSTLQCLNPRDILYGILGIVDNIPLLHDAGAIQSDYTIDVSELYSRVIRLCLETSPTLSILSLMRDTATNSTLNLPSWIPNLHQISQHPAYERLGFGSIRYNAAHQPQNLSPYRSIHDHILHLRGFKLGDLVQFGVSYQKKQRVGPTATILLPSMLDICSELPPIMRDGQDRIQALWKTIIAYSEKYPISPPKDLEACFHDYILWFLFFIKGETDCWPENLTAICKQITKLSEENHVDCPLPDVVEGRMWWSRLQATPIGCAHKEVLRYIRPESFLAFKTASTLSDNILFRTAEGDLGFGPLSSSPGDQVWVLENGRVPFILRPTQDKSSFELVGECYVHGIMDGQLLAHGPLDFVPVSLV